MEEKKPAKIVLRDLQDKIAEDVWEAKRRGEKIGWCASNFPQEITTAMDIKVAYPENMGAAIGAKGGGKRMCEEAEAMGYSNDICSYARMNLAYAAHDDCPEIQIPRPDFLLCCNNICGCMMKWYENLALELDIPLFMIDIPHLTEEVCDADRIAYIRAQFDDCIAGLEKLTGKKMDWDKFREVMEVSQRSSKAWLRAMDAMKNTPSPFSGFDTFNNMAVACVGRGTAEAAEAFELLEQSGKVKWFGVSNLVPMQIELLRKHVKQPLIINQVQLSLEQSQLIDQALYMNNKTTDFSINRDGNLLDYCRLKDITIQAWSPLQIGMFG